MKRVMTAMLLVFCLLGSARANDTGYGIPPAWSMMGTMWEYMEWFLGRDERVPYGGGYYHYPVPGWSADDYRFSTEGFDGIWRALSGEYWLVQGSHFTLYAGPYRQYHGEFRREGNFLRARLPWGESEFSYRRLDDVLLLRDVSGQVMPLYRIRRGGWYW